MWTCKSTTTTANTYAGKWKIKEKEKQKETEVGGKGHICADVLSSWQVTACSKKKEKENGDCPSLQMVLSNAHLYTASLMTYESWEKLKVKWAIFLLPDISKDFREFVHFYGEKTVCFIHEYI